MHASTGQWPLSDLFYLTVERPLLVVQREHLPKLDGRTLNAKDGQLVVLSSAAGVCLTSGDQIHSAVNTCAAFLCAAGKVAVVCADSQPSLPTGRFHHWSATC